MLSIGAALPEKPEFHPKRNQARQKLATLPKVRFRDLASDVYFELERRYPEFKESENPDYADGPPQPQSQPQQRHPQFPNGHPGTAGPASQQQQHNVANETIVPNKSTLVEEDVGMPPSNSTNSMIAQQQQQQQGYPSQSQHQRTRSRGYSASSGSGNAPMPRKSSERDRMRGAGTGNSSGSNDYDTNEQDARSPISPTSSLPGRKPSMDDGGRHDAMGGNGSGAKSVPARLNGPGMPASPEWATNAHSRASEASSIGTRLIGQYGAGGGASSGLSAAGEDAHAEELERVRSEYEFRIATMQSRISALERDLADAAGAVQAGSDRDADRMRALEEQLEAAETRASGADRATEQLERELEQAQRDARDARDREQEHRQRADEAHERAQAQAHSQSQRQEAADEDREEIVRLEDELRDAEKRLRSQSDAAGNLRNEMDGLVDTLREMNQRQDELVTQAEGDQTRITELENEAKEWKKRYEGAKSELRDMKGEPALPACVCAQSANAVYLKSHIAALRKAEQGGRRLYAYFR